MSYRMCHVGRLSIYIWKCNNTARLKNTFFSFNKNKKSILTILMNFNKKHGLVPTDVTVGALPGGGTGAVEGTVRVHTGSAILTRNVQTLVHIYKYSQHILNTTTHCIQCPCNIVSISNFLSILQFIFFFLGQ